MKIIRVIEAMTLQLTLQTRPENKLGDGDKFIEKENTRNVWTINLDGGTIGHRSRNQGVFHSHVWQNQKIHSSL